MRLTKKIFILVIVIILIIVAIKSYGQFYDANGKLFDKRSQETMKPKVIIDTVLIVAGWGSINLNDKFTQGRHNVSPTSPKTIYGNVTPILTDSTKTVYYYGWWFDAMSNRIGIKSNGGAADTGKVTIIMYLK